MNLKQIVETLPLLGSFLIFNGFLKLFYYYNEWDINIIEYLEISEIVLSFLNDINLMVFWLILFLVQQIIAGKVIDVADRKTALNSHNISDLNRSAIANQDTFAPSEESKPISSIIDYFYTQKPVYILFILVISTVLFILLFLFTNKLFWLYFTVFSVFKVVTVILDHLTSLKDELILSASAIITTLFFTYGVAVYDIKERKASVTITETTVELEDRFIKSSSTLFFIGNTQKFIFFYDTIEKRSFIIPMEKIEMISILRKQGT